MNCSPVDRAGRSGEGSEGHFSKIEENIVDLSNVLITSKD